MINQLLEEILTTTYTKQELMKKVRILKSYLEKRIYTEGEPVFGPDIEAEMGWIEAVNKSLLNTLTKETISDSFIQLETEINSLPALTIYLPFELDQSTRVSIGMLLRKTYGNHFVYDAKYNPSLIAGCALVWNGLYKDYSLRGSIEAHKAEIITLIKQSLHSS